MVESEAAYLPAVRSASRFDGKALAESYIEGTEITVGIMDGKLLPIVRIEFEGKTFDQRNKFTPGRSSYQPDGLSSATRDSVVDCAIRFFDRLGIRDYGRIDFIVDRDGRPFLLELNTLPGLTHASVFTYACSLSGWGYAEMISRLVEAVANKYEACVPSEAGLVL